MIKNALNVQRGWSIEECWESKRCPECGTLMDLEG